MSCATPILPSGPLGHVPEMIGHVAKIAGHDPETAGHVHPKYAFTTWATPNTLQWRAGHRRSIQNPETRGFRARMGIQVKLVAAARGRRTVLGSRGECAGVDPNRAHM